MQNQPSGRTATLRRAMRNATTEGLVASASDNFAGPYVSLYALSLGASNAQIGLINALTALVGNVMQLPAAAITERWWRRKYWCVLSSLVNRGLWIVAALLPYFVQGPLAIWVFIAILTVRSLGASFGVPAWTAIMADITPRRLRGSYFAHRNVMLNLSGFGATLLGGWLIKQWGSPFGYQVAFAVSFVFGVAAAVVFSRLQDPGSQAGVARETASPLDELSLRERLRLVFTHLRREKLFTTYTLTALVWNFACTLPGPLFVIFFVNKLHGNDFTWGLTTGVQMLAIMLGQRYWGSLTDRFGAQRIMVISGIGAAAVPILWWIAPTYHYVYAINVFTGFAWAGYNLAAFNFLLEVTPDQGRATYVAGYNGLMGVVTAAGPFLGGVLSEIVGIPAVFIASYVIRMVGWGMLATMIRPAANRPLEWRWFLPGLLQRKRRAA